MGSDLKTIIKGDSGGPCGQDFYATAVNLSGHRQAWHLDDHKFFESEFRLPIYPP